MSGCLTVMLCLSLLLSGCAPAENGGENSLLPPEVVEAFQPEPLGTGEITYEAGAALSADQEALLLDYFTRSYEALARLEEADFADLFSDDTQARISSAEVDLQVGMRTMIDGLDYSLTGYQYTILCRGVSAQEDGSVAVDAMERSTQNFAQLPGITSERSRTFHRFVLEQRNGAWTIRSHMQYNALFGQLMDLAGGMAAEAPEAYLSAAESYLDTLQAARDALEAQRGEAGSLPDADVAYDREAALAYADQYAMTRNPEQARDPKLSWRERLWGTRHDITEGFGAAPKDVVVPFIHPVELGFDRDLYEAFPGTIIAMASDDVRTVSLHFVRPVEGGVELRSRFWFGWRLIDGKVARGDDITYPEGLPRSLLLHNIKEFTNLARLLPRIFPEERDNF